MNSDWLIDTVASRWPISDCPDWPNTNINPKISSPLGDRIPTYISNLGQHLKNKILFNLNLVPLFLVAETSQSNLGDLSHNSNDKDQSPSDDDDSPSNTDDLPSDEGIIYARVSGHGQTESDDSDEDNESNDDGSSSGDSGSIGGQIEELEQLAQDRGIKIAAEPFTDKAKTGTNFNRPGIQSVFNVAQRDEVKYLLVEKVDRIGRSAAETLYFIHILQKECDVTLLTPSGEQNVGEVQGLVSAALRSLMAQVQNELRVEKAKKERVRSFVEKRNWNASSPVVPLGYRMQTEEGQESGWIEVDPDEKEVVEDLFDRFTNTDYQAEEDPEEVSYRSYAGTERAIDNEYGTEFLDGHRVRTLLRDPVYIGEPEIPESWVADLSYDNVVEDSDLEIIDEETFEHTQEIINEKDEKHSRDEETNELLDFLEEFDPFTLTLSSERVALLHDCGNPMVRDGQAELNGEIKTHRYKCNECNETRKWPKNYEYERMEIIHMLLDDDVAFLEVVRKIQSYLVD